MYYDRQIAKELSKKLSTNVELITKLDSKIDSVGRVLKSHIITEAQIVADALTVDGETTSAYLPLTASDLHENKEVFFKLLKDLLKTWKKERLRLWKEVHVILSDKVTKK